MSTRFHHTAALIALAAACAFAQAQTPTRVGRIALAQGQVTIGGELGDEASEALVNWPVTSRNQITTGRDARTEIRIGSTAVRLDADSALDVVELDDNILRLHLHYGSATVRLRNPDLLRGFEITTPQAVIQFQDPGRMRIDAGRRQDTTVVSVFDGVALVDGAATRMTLRAGKRAEIVQDDFRTGLALRDGFDEWSMLRDERDDRSESVRYVTSEMTGYEDLDQNGIWRDDREYGPLWSPRVMPLGWAPYRDGQWTYVQPWGWTWVDNAPWGYAPFHYGRWVMVNQRWCWAPGRDVSRVVWSPALVGWVGGSNWSVSFNTRGTHRAAPAQGWYPLAPHDTYVPTYRVDHDKLRYLNRSAGGPQADIRGGHRRYEENQRVGLTVLPQAQFVQRGTVPVRGAPQVIASTSALLAAPTAPAPVAPLAVRARAPDEHRDVRIAPDPRRFEREDGGRGIARGVAPAAGAAIELKSPPSAAPRAAPVSPAAILFRRDRDGRPLDDDVRRPRMETPNRMPTPAPPMPPAQAAAPQMAPQPAPMGVPQRDERGGRFERNDGERRQRERDAEREARPRSAEPVQQQAPQVRPSPLQMMMQRAPVQQQAQPQPQPQPQRAPVPMAQPQAPQQPQPQPQAARPAPPAASAEAKREAARDERHRGKNEVER